MKKKTKPRDKSRLKLTALVKLLEFNNMNFSLGEGKRGRPPRSPEAMLKAFVVMVFKGFSERELETFLRSYPFWGRLCGFKGKPPCHATFSNFKRRIGEEELKRVMKDLVSQLIEAGAIKLVKIACDSSTLSASLSDKDAQWGFTWEGPFHGYKIHIVCCADSELPVYIRVTPGNVHDSTECLALVRGARSYGKSIHVMVADTAYDTIEIIETLMEKYHILPVMPFNPRNGKKTHDYGVQRLYFYETAFLKHVYKKRTAVERVNNIITEELGLKTLQYKGLKAVTFQAYITCITQLAAALTAVSMGYPEHMRKISLFR